ncbi:MAG: hypothetical protein ACRDIY_19080, partial [Chloroflexota bacterium]
MRRSRIGQVGTIVATIVALLAPFGLAPSFAWADRPPPLPPATAPATAITLPASPSHDWRVPGDVAAVGGELFDPSCVPLRAVGSNVPNLPYHAGVAANLEWMRQHHVRWVRVFATGHGSGPFPSPRNATDAVTALRALLAQVETFNLNHDPGESIYVLISLTDYYPPGVPGDRYAFDHPIFRLSPVLPAPWFRPGVRRFDFEQEHGLGTEYAMPNYEVYDKPWVEHIVSSLAGSPAILG